MFFPKLYATLAIAAHARSSADEIKQLEDPSVGTGPGVLIETQNLHLDGTLEEFGHIPFQHSWPPSYTICLKQQKMGHRIRHNYITMAYCAAYRSDSY
jgi:hypothetical protein